MERIAVLGSTGSIGTSGLDVIAKFPDRFKVCALSANTNVKLLKTQVERFRPEAICITGPSSYMHGYKVYESSDGLCRMIEDVKIDTILMGIVGSSALLPILTALNKVKK